MSSTAGETAPPGDEQLSQAKALLATIPPELRQATHNAFSARAVIYLLLLDRKEGVRNKQLSYLEKTADQPVLDELNKLLAHTENIKPSLRVPLMEMAMPYLRQLSVTQQRAFRQHILALIKADKRIAVTEWAIHKTVSQHLSEAFDGNHRETRFSSIEEVGEHCCVLLSMLAYSDQQAKLEPEQAFSAGIQALGLDLKIMPKTAVSLAELNRSVDAIAQLDPKHKPAVLQASLATIAADKRVAPIEELLLRTVACVIDSPMPPLPR